MKRAAAVVAVVLLAVVGFQLADPRLGSGADEPVSVDADAPADELARDAIRSTYRSNYSYEYTVADNRSFADPKLVKAARVDTDARVFRSVSRYGSDGPVVYGTTDAVFVRPLPTEGWGVNANPAATYPNDVTHPLVVDRITAANSRVVNRTDGVVVVRVDRRLVPDASLSGYSLVYVNTDRGTVRKVVGVVERDGRVEGYDRVVFTDVGSTTVERPPGTRFKPYGVLLDLLR